MPDISPKPLRILALEAQNIKKLRIIEIAPKSNVVRIQGKNGSGKTSTLDSIIWCLGGKNEIQMKPIRDGEERGIVRLGIGSEALEYVVTRQFRQKAGDDKYTTALTIETAKGALVDSPQTFLKQLFGTLSLDPQEFDRMAPKDRLNALKKIVKLDIDVEELDAINRGDFARRQDVNREVDRLEKEVSLYAGGLMPKMDVTPVDTAPMFADMAKASEFNSSIAQEDFTRINTRALLERAVSSVKRFDAEMDALMERRKSAQQEAEQLAATIQGWKPLAEPLDVTELTETIKRAQQDNSAKEIQRRARERYVESKKQYDAVKAESNALTEAMAGREAKKAQAMSKAKFPVDGLSFGEDGVLFNGLPFDQASAAERLRASFGVAAAVRPRLPVVLIKDGSLMDDDSMKLLEELAQAYDAQVWIERVGAGNVGIVLEDGVVVAVDGVPTP